MKKFAKFILIVLTIEILLIGFTNFFYINNSKKNDTKIYREEDNNQIVYRVEYNSNKNNFDIILINMSLGISLILTILSFIYVNKKIIKPFQDIKEIPYELAKGNLNIPLKEQKNKYFGKFTWGMDMLRENLEDNKKRELKYQKEKKTLILSLSHDIKTPLSAIKLYSKALKDSLYDTEEKKNEVIDGILKNADEIEHYVSEIVKNSRDDFMDLPVNNQDFYLKEVIDQIKKYYTDKLETIHTKFTVDEFNNCILKGDKDRVVEVIQNVIENAIKYGDGKKISIEFSEEEDCKLITILNTGCNLNSNDLPHIYDSFYRGSNTKDKEGSGLGLFICKQLMYKMDGDVYSKIRKNNNFETTIVIRKI